MLVDRLEGGYILNGRVLLKGSMSALNPVEHRSTVTTSVIWKFVCRLKVDICNSGSQKHALLETVTSQFKISLPVYQKVKGVTFIRFSIAFDVLVQVDLSNTHFVGKHVSN